MKPIGIDIPIQRGEQGFFKQTFSTTEAIKANIRNLLLTNNGERPINPSFGNGLNNLVFEQDEEITKEKIRDTIITTINRFIPSVTVNSITFKDRVNDNTIQFEIIFSLKKYPNFIDRIEMELDAG